MKKNIWKVLLAALLCMALVPAAVMAEEAPDTLLEGFVTEILEEGFVMEDADMGEVMVNTSEVTVWDGILLDSELEVGQYVIVHYDGRMTFSLPPQVHADLVGCYVLDGMVTEVLDGAFLMVGDPVFDHVYVTTGEGFPPVYADMAVKVYYDGVMTLSLPGRANARHIVVPQLHGTASEVTEEGFLLTDADGLQYQVFLGENTVMGEVLPELEDELTEETDETGDVEIELVGEETAEEEPVEESEAVSDEEPAEAAEEILLINVAEGDTVTVYYSGASTRSLPPQLTAQEVRIHR
ncbi:MAG: hypothetical protein IKJ26_09520 [Clostridia bacterium]|nr:hypothetical protein [Clostridia bacterium]